MASSHNFVKLFEDFQMASMSASGINDIFYGNPTKEKCDIAYVKTDRIRDWFIEKGLANKMIQEAPANDSDVTRKDLEILLGKIKNVTGEDVTFARYVEEVDNMAQTFVDLLASKGIELTMGEFFGIDSQTESIVFWLKDKINRPRPNQLARVYGMPIYPLMHTDACSAAYPSGHATTAFVMSEYLSRKYPEHRAELESLGKRIADSREKMGIHYPSDTALARTIADIIFQNNLLTSR